MEKVGLVRLGWRLKGALLSYYVCAEILLEAGNFRVPARVGDEVRVFYEVEGLIWRVRGVVEYGVLFDVVWIEGVMGCVWDRICGYPAKNYGIGMPPFRGDMRDRTLSDSARFYDALMEAGD